MNFLHFAALLFVISCAALVAGSFTAPPEPEEKLAGLTMQTFSRAEGGAPNDRRRNLFLSLLVIFCVAAVWTYFR